MAKPLCQEWSLTQNNPPEPYVIPQLGDYTKGQLEKGENGTIHWQLYVYYRHPISFKTIKRRVGDSYHIEPAKDPHSLKNYVWKADTRIQGPFEWGSPPKQGKRTDLEDCCAVVKSEGLKRAIDAAPAVYVKFHRGLELYAEHVREPYRRDISLRPWQAEALGFILGCTSDRAIHWFRDRSGNSGKSVLSTYLSQHHDALLLTEGRYADWAFQYKHEPIVVFALARETDQELIKAAARFAEGLKDGHVTSSKYESKTKYFKPATVVFFSNTDPPYASWSHNRLISYDIEDGQVRKEGQEEQAFRA